jgi:hypothetical protein
LALKVMIAGIRNVRPFRLVGKHQSTRLHGVTLKKTAILILSYVTSSSLLTSSILVTNIILSLCSQTPSIYTVLLGVLYRARRESLVSKSCRSVCLSIRAQTLELSLFYLTWGTFAKIFWSSPVFSHTDS